MEVRLSLQASLVLLLLLFAGAYAVGTPVVSVPAETESEHRLDEERLLRVLLGDTVQELPMDEYLTGVLRAEMPASFEMEALKAQTVAARSYTLYKMKQGAIARHPQADTCDDISCCKAYCTAEAAAEQWGSQAEDYERKLREAVAQTDGLVASYGGEPILAVFHSSAAGQTQNAEEVWQNPVPYLKSVQSPEVAEDVPNYYSTAVFTAQEARERLQAARPALELSASPQEWLGAVSVNAQGLVTDVELGGEHFTGGELRSVFDLRSACFTVRAEEDTLHFSVTAYGHGVGMSQYGANALARQGLSFEEILAWYYTGITVEPYAGE